MRKGEILRRGCFFVLIISIVFSFIVIPAFSGAQIWTEDEQGNPRTDFEPDENVYIWGSGFYENAKIDISITRPDNVVENYLTYSYENGWFLYIYTLDGMIGTYYVTATDGVNSASTTFEDCLRILEGYDKAASRWERGLLEGWKELDWVPYRILFSKLPKGISNFNFKVCHNNLLDNKDGVDKLRNFRVGDVNGNPVDGSVTASGPFYKTPGKGCDRDIYYSLSVTFTTPSSGLSWYVYWEAHVAFGASGWPGAKLHAYTENLTGSQDVPIKVPPTPVGSISGAKWNDLNYSGIRDPGEPGLPGWTIQLHFFDNVENTWINLDNENTGSGGSYTFSKLVAGNYRLTEVLKENWRQTCPSSPPGYRSIILSEGENRRGENFGNILIIHGVDVSVSPSYQSGSNGATLNYTVTVANTGNVSDTYDLSLSDVLGWGPSVSPTWLTVPAGENRTATLTVRIPDNAMGSTQDNITVTATSREDSVSDSAVCATKVLVSRGVDVSISPDNRTGVPCTWLEYTVTLTNTGNVGDTYDLSWADTQGWSDIWLEDNSLWAASYGGVNSTTLHVHVPEGAKGNTWDDITVIATSRENANVRDNDTCRANVNIVRGVDVTISPTEDSGLPGESLIYIVTVKNTGNVPDNYGLENVDTLSWPLSLGRSLIEVPEGENRTTTLTINIPLGARGCTKDNITVTVTSQENSEVSDSASCTAHVENVYGVGVSISPKHQSGIQGAILTYIATVKNIGNTWDNYVLTKTDELGWVVTENFAWVSLQPGDFASVNFDVIIPENVDPGSEDTIVVLATSSTDNAVENRDNCTACVAVVRDVDILVLPPSDNGLIKDVIITNKGNVVDSYDLTAEDNVGWSLVLADNLVKNVMPGENGMTTLTITIPSNTMSGTVGSIVVNATSQEDPEVSGSGGAQVTAIKEVEVWIEPSYQKGAPRDRLVYIVTVGNIGNTWDNYYLTKTDALGWIVTENFAWIPLAPGDSASVSFEVFIPENVKACTKDIITATATSEEDADVSDNDSCIAHAVSENAFTVSLVAGWNLVGFTGVSEDDNLGNIFRGLNYYEDYYLYYWNAPGGPYGVDLDASSVPEDNLGYWVWVNRDWSVCVTGVPPDSREIHLVAGWNLVSFPVVDENTTIGKVFTGLTYYENYYLYYWNAPGGPYGVDLDETSLLKDNMGYWVWIDRNWTVTVP